MPGQFSRNLTIALALLAGAPGCEDGAGPSPSLIGIWDLASFGDHGVVGATTGTMEFQPSGTFKVLGTVTYPGEPADSLKLEDTWTLAPGRVTLTTGSESEVWGMAWPGQELTLTLEGPPPTNVIVLRRPVP